jgi:FixJ family two-component response regulator
MPRLPEPPLIAIVDDDEAVREALADLLEVEGLLTRMFDSAVAFLAFELCERFDCVISDVRMPELDGLELLQRLRARGAATPVIFITASTHEATRVRAVGAGAAAWFTKPVAEEALLSELHIALGRSRT